MKMKGRIVASAGLLAIALGGCSAEGKKSFDDQDIARQVAETLVAACPLAEPGDEQARAQCAANLSDNKALGTVMREPFFWGGQKAGTSYNPLESDMNRFNVLVWRRLYLSLFMFTGQITIDPPTEEGRTVVHLPYVFRNELEIGSYPYPFWHSKKKWDSWQFAQELILIIQDGQWTAAMRSAVQDTARPFVSHSWSGQWTWEKGGEEMPYVTLYKYLLSPQNPNTTRLDSAYRNLSEGMRNQSCVSCHSPDNYAQVTQLEFFNYPNQALMSRNTIIMHLENNTMPPAANTLGLPAGVTDEEERAELLTLAREFKAAGDAALEFEGELK